MASIKVDNEAALKDYLLAVARLPRPSLEQRAALLALGREGEGRALRELMEGFLPMVVAQAAARRGLGLRFHALLEAGNRALAAALRAYQGDAGDLEGVLSQAVEAAIKRAWTQAAWASANGRAAAPAGSARRSKA